MKKTFAHTKKEIEGQPDLWLETLQLIHENSDCIDFLHSVYSRDRLNVVLTGAGSSAFIGETVEHLFEGRQASARALPTTTLVTHFKDYIDTSTPLLLISFARSGNSPESIAVVDIAESRCGEVHHLAITCNKSGRLAQKIQQLENGCTVVLPPASEDRGLAMTGSFTSMVLSAVYYSKFRQLKNNGTAGLLSKIADDSRHIINTAAKPLKSISEQPFNRIVFLGSGPLLGIARESHLKVQELSDGEVVGKFDSFLGFRHGPKAVVDKQTILVFLFSSDKHVFRYEKDLVEQIVHENTAMKCIGVFHNRRQAEAFDLDLNIAIRQGDEPAPSDYDLLPYVLPAQMIGFYKSLDLGLKPDAPSKNNAISRVVKGVKIYPESKD
ncbi:galactosamine 6-phosphate isomerase AgaS [Fodinibius roseus]|uniref:Galactosamine 6-phosphate isomerase AgaS n=1 Tax=Fodinibius roseus TaxID=1194090 RepID=A0A1M5JKR6_9BACT|nr:SIS domain-containing protein [Fodinibius roseus]SHG40859.1 galactosamine 6-phosphate isomerase AgaS [Fodinibius roseus]